MCGHPVNGLEQRPKSHRFSSPCVFTSGQDWNVLVPGRTFGDESTCPRRMNATSSLSPGMQDVARSSSRSSAGGGEMVFK